MSFHCLLLVVPSVSNLRKTIVVAEDDTAIAALLKKALGKRYEVHMATDGAQALALCTRHPLDLLLTDVMMPVLDGFHLAHQMRLVPGRDSVPIIFLTAKQDASDTITGIRLGARHYLRKPFVLADLLRKVEGALR